MKLPHPYRAVPQHVTGAPAPGLDLHHTHPVWSPDGRLVAYAVIDDDGVFGHVFTITASGTTNTQVTLRRGDRPVPGLAAALTAPAG
jgi:hypothetical protein